jgi:glucose/arabinose dehydrogenase
MREMDTVLAGARSGRPPHVAARIARVASLVGTFLALLLFFASPAAHAMSMELIATGFTEPMTVTSAPDDNSTLFVAEKGGIIYAVDRQTGTKSVFLDISSKVETTGERGLLGFTFDPNFQTNGRFYVDYSNAAGNTVIERYQVSSGNPSIGDPASASPLLTVDQPANTSHKAGWIGFRPGEPNNLYIATGDGAYVDNNTPDPYGNGQNLSSNLGKILRIDVTTGTAANNTFSASANPEIWAYGLRNPFRNSFDRVTGDLWIADVGFTSLDEVNFLAAGTPAGTNFGWALREGNPGATPAGLTDPIFTVPVGAGAAIIGGIVYRGPIDTLYGLYFFADYVNKTVKSFRYDPDTGIVSDLIDWTQIWFALFGDVRVTSFGEDNLGNMFLTDFQGGRLFGLMADPVPLPASLPLLLSGVIGLGMLAYRRTKKSAAAVATA